MKKILTASAIALAATLATVSVQADTIGFSFAAKGYSSTLTDNDAKVDSDTSTNVEYTFALEHPVPIIPNVRVAYADFSFDGKWGSPLTSTIEQSFVEGTLYYELLDNIVELDLGLTARVMDASLSDVGLVTDFKNDNTAALLFLKVQGNLPVTGLSLGGLAQAGGNASDTIMDVEVYVQYEFSFGLGLSAGYRVIEQELEYESKTAKDVDSDTSFAGSYVAVFYHF